MHVSANVLTVLLVCLMEACLPINGLAGEQSSVSMSRSVFPKSNKKHLLILGLGRVGLECGLLAAADEACQFDAVVGTVRSWPPKSILNDGIVRVPFTDLEQEIKDASHVLWTIPLPKEDDGSVAEALQLLKSNNDHLEWVGMISTTGIYGNHDGNWVTEDSPLLCTAESNAYLYRDVEELFYGLGGKLFRCAGIYDSTRSALHTVYKNGIQPCKAKISGRERSITNRIHSYDIAKSIIACMRSPSRTPQIYNLADDEPAPRADVMEYAADLLASIGVTLEQAKQLKNGETAEPPPSTKRERRRQTDRKLVSNERMKKELLGPNGLTYSTYKEGLEAILKDPTTPWQKVLEKP